jgi:hypothetical protein
MAAGRLRLRHAPTTQNLRLLSNQRRLKQAVAPSQGRRRLRRMGISVGRTSSTGSSCRSDERSLQRLSELTKRERTSMTWLSVLTREVVSSNARNDAVVIWVSRCCASPPVHRSARYRCLQHMPALDFDKRKVSSLSIDFVDVRFRMDTELARTVLTVLSFVTDHGVIFHLGDTVVAKISGSSIGWWRLSNCSRTRYSLARRLWSGCRTASRHPRRSFPRQHHEENNSLASGRLSAVSAPSCKISR